MKEAYSTATKDREIITPRAPSREVSGALAPFHAVSAMVKSCSCCNCRSYAKSPALLSLLPHRPLLLESHTLISRKMTPIEYLSGERNAGSDPARRNGWMGRVTDKCVTII
ncbi:hypothetical protein Bbelb_172350 [Branchiostoma belcheri]|nr:hypothetical protein Bbelb_172350 [Branchiostoma belcheri]